MSSINSNEMAKFIAAMAYKSEETAVLGVGPITATKFLLEICEESLSKTTDPILKNIYSTYIKKISPVFEELNEFQLSLEKGYSSGNNPSKDDSDDKWGALF